MSVAPAPTDPSIDRARRGDRAAWAGLLRQYAPSIHGLCRRLDPDPDDCCQEIWVKLMGAIDRYDPERAAFLSWAHTIAHRHGGPATSAFVPAAGRRRRCAGARSL